VIVADAVERLDVEAPDFEARAPGAEVRLEGDELALLQHRGVELLVGFHRLDVDVDAAEAEDRALVG
jgi:hypothetical protein